MICYVLTTTPNSWSCAAASSSNLPISIAWASRSSNTCSVSTVKIFSSADCKSNAQRSCKVSWVFPSRLFMWFHIAEPSCIPICLDRSFIQNSVQFHHSQMFRQVAFCRLQHIQAIFGDLEGYPSGKPSTVLCHYQQSPHSEDGLIGISSKFYMPMGSLAGVDHDTMTAAGDQSSCLSWNSSEFSGTPSSKFQNRMSTLNHLSTGQIPFSFYSARLLDSQWCSWPRFFAWSLISPVWNHTGTGFFEIHTVQQTSCSWQNLKYKKPWSTPGLLAILKSQTCRSNGTDDWDSTHYHAQGIRNDSQACSTRHKYSIRNSYHE